MDYISKRLLEIETMEGKEFYDIVNGEAHCKEITDATEKKVTEKTEKPKRTRKPKAEDKSEE